MTSAVAVLLLPVMAIPFIFGGPRAKQLQITKRSTARKVPAFCTCLLQPHPRAIAWSTGGSLRGCPHPHSFHQIGTQDCISVSNSCACSVVGL